MHIPDNYLSPQTCAVMTAAMVPVWAVSIKKIKTGLPKEKITMLGVGAAFSFLGMMFNIPVPGGTTGHAVGGTMIASVLGPYAACIAVSVALLIQALVFGDGGILSFGANCFNMAFVLPFVGYSAARLVSKILKNKNADVTGAVIGSYAGINAAALCAAVEFGIQPMLFRDAAGNALYCPYGLSVSIPAVMAGHLTLFGLAEAVYTGAVLMFIKKVSPGYTGGQSTEDRSSLKTALPVKLLLAALIVLTPLGLLAEGTAWGEWGADEIASTGAGFTPDGMLSGLNYTALLPDYSVAGMPGWFGYLLSAAIGASVLIIVFKLVSQVWSDKREKAAA